MSETLDGGAAAPQGKQMGVAGFVLSLVALLFSSWIFGISVISIASGGSGWLMYLWLVLAIVSVVLSAMAMSKLGKTGGKKGLAIAGLIIGIVATVWCGICVAGLAAASSATSQFGDEIQNQLENNADYQEMLDQLENM